jgi:Prophage tail length tape measure protein
MPQVVGDLLVLIRGDAKPLQASLTQAQASTSKFGATMSKFGSLAPLAFAAAGAAVVKFVGDSVAAAAASEQVFAQTEAVIKSTGGAAGVTADEMRDLAASFQDTTTFSDEAVLSAENLLLTFTKIGGETIPEATEAVLNMSTALGQDLKSSAIQLGKALNNPSIGLTALRRVGVAFTDDQVELIKTLDETGRSAEAQAIILAELNKEFGGSAAAAADTYAGRLAQLGNAFNDMQEVVGRAVIPVLEDLMPLMETGVVVLEHLAEASTLASDNLDLLGRSLNLSGLGFLSTLRTMQDNNEVVEEATEKFRELQSEEVSAWITGTRDAWVEALGPTIDYLEALGGLTEEQRRAVETGKALSAQQREAAGGLLGLIEAANSYKQAQREVNELEAKGAEGTREYREAVAALITERLELTGAVEELQAAWKEEGTSLAEAKQGLADVGRQAGLAGADLRRFVQTGLKPIAGEINALRRSAARPITFHITADTSQLQSKIAGLGARFGGDFGGAGSTVTRNRRIVIDRKQNSDALSFEERYGPN